MNKRLVFFVDDFGTRTICKSDVSVPLPTHEFSFGLGGIMVEMEKVEFFGELVSNFCQRWNVPSLHGNKIRAAKGKFGFLKNNQYIKDKFLSELEEIILNKNLIVHACVICRPGYRDRYSGKYVDSTRWEMSRTAFDIAIERAAKLAREKESKLNVVYEKSGKKEDRLIERYFSDLKKNGLGFDIRNSSKYDPLNENELSHILASIRSDNKDNPLLQLADLVLHPICHITSGCKNTAYLKLHNNKQLIDHKSKNPQIAIKYSCYDNTYGNWENSLQKHLRDPEGSLKAVGV